VNIIGQLDVVERRIAQLDGPPAAADADFARLLRPVPASEAALAAPNLTPQIDALVRANAERFGVDPRLVRAVIACESGGDAAATSPAGAAGLMQLMPRTAAELGISDPYDQAQNIAGGTRYLRSLLDRFGGDVVRALAAYNAGPGAVERYDGIPPFAQTQHYVARVLDRAARDPRNT
jgi:soluble lytic murein transglycosylase-like protein